MTVKGFRNVFLVVLAALFFGFLTYRVDISSPEMLRAYGDTCLNVGIFFAAAILGRAANKWAEAKNGEVQ